MAFDTSNDYSDFDGIGSGEIPGSIEGLLEIPEGASAFRYRKTIIVNVYINILDFGDSYQDLIGKWKVRIRADSSRNADGSYSGEILFEQEVQWTARIYIENHIGVALVTWQPLGDGGSGKQMTTICNGEACAVVTDVNDAAAMTAYGQTGAWRFLDNSTVKPTATDRAKYDVEKGVSIFQDEGVGTVGTYKFFADWQSADYLCEIPEGAILETVMDGWGQGRLDSEAQYLFSHKPGEGGAQALCDAWSGQTWSFQKDKGALLCLRSRTETFSEKIQIAPKSGAFRALQHGHNLTVTLQNGSDLMVYGARDDGRFWTGYKVTSDIKFLDSVGDTQNSEIVMFGTATAASPGIASGDFVRVLVTWNGSEFGVKERNKVTAAREKVPLPAKPKGRFTRQDTAIIWLFQDKDTAQVWRSLDNGLSFDLVSG